MKKVLMSVVLVSAIAIAADYSMVGSGKSEMNLSDLAQANVEALAHSLLYNCVCVSGGIVCHCGDYILWGKSLRIVEQDD